MDKSPRLAMTAIRDMDQERFVASALLRIGWEVIYRATTSHGLATALTEHPSALLFRSDDFKLATSTQVVDAIILRGRSLPALEKSPHDPISDNDFEELIRNRNNLDQSQAKEVPAKRVPTRAFASIGRSLGLTTFSIAVAEELAMRGKKVLLVDGHLNNPSLSQHFQIHGIRKKIEESRFGFALFELSTLESLHYLASEVDRFDEIVIDFGELISLGEWIDGKRIQDQFTTWLLRSHAAMNIALKAESRSIGRLNVLLDSGAKQLKESPQAALIFLDKAMGTKERKEITSSLSIPVTIFSSDTRSIEKSVIEHSTLGVSAPRSTLKREIDRYLS